MKRSEFPYGKLDIQLYKDMKKELQNLKTISKLQKNIFLLRLKNRLKFGL